METKKITIWDIIRENRESCKFQSRFVGSGPTHEWTGEANLDLVDQLLDSGYPFEQFVSNVKGQPLYKKICVKFVTFGNPPD